MKKSAYSLCLFIGVVLCTSCSVNKFIPEDNYLLDEVRIVSDTKEVRAASFTSYIRQNPNAKWFKLVKVPMHTYCISGRDSSKWINRFFRKIGDAPVIYDETVTRKSQDEIEKAVRNMGYMEAVVQLDKQPRKNRMKLSYHIRAGHPYIVRSLVYDIGDEVINAYLSRDSAQSLLHPGMILDVDVLEAERQRITRILQNRGYYKFNKDFIVYQADTVRNTYRVDLTLQLLPYRTRKEDAPRKHEQYTVRDIRFFADNEILASQGERNLEGFDSLSYRGYEMYYKDKLFLRPRLLLNFNYLRPGELYSEQDVQSTYANLSRLRALRYSNIRFYEAGGNDSLKLDAWVMLAKNKSKSMSFEIEGTNSAGDLGAAASVSYQHRNLFKGSEMFTLKVRGAYEAITGLGSSQDYVNDNYVEYSVESSLNFPEFMFPFLSSDFKKKIKATSEVGLKFTSQIRPEFSRTLASASWSYKWNNHKRIQHRFDLIDINYVYMPRTSVAFQEYLEEMTKQNSLLEASYRDQLVVRMGYSLTFNSAGNSMLRTPTKDSYSIHVNVEESGNLLYGISKLVHPTPKKGDSYVLANIPFAQYVKMDLDFAKNYMIDIRNSFVFHVGVGMAFPYGNAKALPFEKKYFSGGANSVRGWSVRSLGPGVYKSADGSLNFINQAGDLKLDLNVEYRTHLFWKLNGAAFVDAGNIWTIRKDSQQEGGEFKFNEFYKQIAMAYGLGIRFDLDYLILRFDGGMKAVNPSETGSERYPLVHPRFSRDFAFHFAVGYPF